jgi:hypothetical protein
MDEMKGRFAQILHTKVPEDGLRQFAKPMLKVKGVSRATSAATQHLPRTRG